MTVGNLVSWKTALWKLENMVEESITVREMCKPLRPGNILFPERRNMTSGIDLCRKMRAIVSVVDSKTTLNKLASIHADNLGRYNGGRCKYIWLHFLALFVSHIYLKIAASFWNGWWDEPHEGTFSNVNNGDILTEEQYQPWLAGEPNGGRIENCGIVWLDTNAFNDMPCGYGSQIFCSFERAPYLQIRGWWN